MAAPRQKVEWPAPVRAYVQRAFLEENELEGVDPDEMREELKSTISYYALLNATDTVDWANYPLPQRLIIDRREAKRREAAANTTNDMHTAHMNNSSNQANLSAPNSKKRKSQGAEETHADASVPPWEKTNLASRMTFAQDHNDKRRKKNALQTENDSKLKNTELEKRRQRFNLPSNTPKKSPPWNSPRNKEDDMQIGPIVGTNQNLEKSYFRLTAPPQPETVRPLHILEQSLAMLTEKWLAEKRYNYICNQFKSLRQDLTVQHIKTAFTVKVYETHARLALENVDLGEYNQCQTQLKALYAQNLGGRPAEFTAYRILYFVYTCNKTGLNDMLSELTPADKCQEFIKHALDVRSSLALGNYHKFFRLYLEAPNMGAYLMDMFIERERINALANFSRGYQNVTLRFLTDELGFDDHATCREFLEARLGKDLIKEQGDHQFQVNIRAAAGQLETLRAAASKVDIKGQL